MRPSHYDALDRWLKAERDDRSEAADEALFELFKALPLIAPPAGFADRVLSRAGLQAAAVRRDLFASRVARLAVVLCLMSLGLGVLWLPLVLRALASLWGPWSFGDLVQGGVRALIDATRWLASALRIGDVLFGIGRALTQALTVPQVTAGLVVCLIVSSLAFRYLRDQITGERNWTHVDRI
ncbi:MAG TPA: hypothetical protein VHC97_14570 [Thermoanaerobaculia bacterium]|jgi:hypothetical protein|nr:hypothetical protein [Thermoanaerobaculia bacterium]